MTEQTCKCNAYNKIMFEVITTIKNGEQIIFDLDLYKDRITEEKMITSALAELSVDELKNLVKFSFCQIRKSENEKIVEWFSKTNGKYYFISDINPDNETKYWKNFRDDFIDNKRK